MLPHDTPRRYDAFSLTMLHYDVCRHLLLYRCFSPDYVIIAATFSPLLYAAALMPPIAFR